jgi:hypothetical protein
MEITQRADVVLEIGGKDPSRAVCPLMPFLRGIDDPPGQLPRLFPDPTGKPVVELVVQLA